MDRSYWLVRFFLTLAFVGLVGLVGVALMTPTAKTAMMVYGALLFASALTALLVRFDYLARRVRTLELYIRSLPEPRCGFQQ